MAQIAENIFYYIEFIININEPYPALIVPVNRPINAPREDVMALI